MTFMCLRVHHVPSTGFYSVRVCFLTCFWILTLTLLDLFCFFDWHHLRACLNVCLSQWLLCISYAIPLFFSTNTYESFSTILLPRCDIWRPPRWRPNQRSSCVVVKSTVHSVKSVKSQLASRLRQHRKSPTISWVFSLNLVTSDVIRQPHQNSKLLCGLFSSSIGFYSYCQAFVNI